MFYKTKYGIGTKVNVMYDPNDNKLPVITDNKFGIVYEIKALDPTMSYYLPIGKKPLPFVEENNA